jgi:SPOR domain
MAESVKPRFAVDLDEIERQLADAHSAPQSPPASRNDPLAELARIVGQDDPFQSMLANNRAPTPKTRPPAAADDLFVSRDDRPRQPAAPDRRGSFSPNQPTDLDAAYAEQVRQYEAFPAETPPDGYVESDYEQDRYPDPSSFEDPDEISHRTLPPRTSRKTGVAIAAIVGAAVLGVGGALIAGRSTSMLSSGEPPLIKATNEPSKVQPQSPGGVEFPNQNKQIYERAGQETQTKVVNREEQPVDVRQATRTGSTDAAGPAGNSAAPTGLALGEPRKVRTISIRPDGTVILPDAKPAAAPAAMTLPPTTQARAPQAAMPLAPVAAETPHAGSAGTTPAPRLAAATPSASGGSSPQAASTPQPGPQRVASAQPGVVPAAAQPASQRLASVQPTAPAGSPQPADAASGEGFSVQLGVSASETEAKATLQRFQQKFTDLKGKAPLIRKAEVNGSTLYRVRVGPMPRDEAASLCSKIQGQGGQCFVAKN